MAKGIDKLTALGVKKTSTAGYYGDGGGLWLQISKTGTKSWIFRFTSPATKKAREMGLGSVDTYSLNRPAFPRHFLSSQYVQGEMCNVQEAIY